MKRIITAVLALCLVAGCAVNPVTGRNELNMVSMAQQRQIGAEQYGPSKQSQGGEYNTDPALQSYVNEVGQRISRVSDVELDYEFVVLNNGVPNAWALPGGKIAINRGLLLELNNEAELAAVLGHEVVHAAASHGAQAMTRGTLLQGAMVLGAIAASNQEYADYIIGASALGAQLITQRYGREAERESDYYGIHYMVEAGYDPRAAVTLQEVFVRLSEGAGNSSWLDGLFASHPPSVERVMNNQALVDELLPTLAGRDLELGEARYQQAIAGLKEAKPAYDLMAEAERAITEDDLELAWDKLDDAIRIFPDEARFHGLQADILVYQRRYRAAVERYDETIAMDDEYFDYFLGRGVAYSRLNQPSRARSDLERSAALLPTAMAANELGKVSLAEGRRAEAKQHFQNAASAGGPLGQEALSAFLQLDVGDNPATYVQAETYADANGRIIVRVTNTTPVTLRNIEVQVQAVINGAIAQRNVRVGNLEAGSYQDFRSGMAFPQGTVPSADMMRAVVSAATP